MNLHSIKRLKLAKKLVNQLITESEDDILSVFVTSSVARGNANKFSDIDIHIIYKEYKKPFKQYATLENNITVEWVWESREHYEDIEEIKINFAKPYNIYSSKIIYDPEEWFLKIKQNIEPFVYDKQYIKLRVRKLYESVEGIYKEIGNSKDSEHFIEYYKMLLLPTLLIPITATAQDPNPRKLLIQAEKGLTQLGLKHEKNVFLKMIGCDHFTKKETKMYLDNLMEMYDYCIENQTADYHGINLPKRNYYYKNILKLINKGYYKHSIYIILDLMWIIDYRLTVDNGDMGWWTMMVKGLQIRLGLDKSGWKEKLKEVIYIENIIKKNIIQEERVYIKRKK